MDTISIVLIRPTAKSFRHFKPERLDRLAAIAGAPAVVVRQTGTWSEGASEGARRAEGDRCLFAEDEADLTEEAVQAHRRTAGATVVAGPLPEAVDPDAVVAFALGRGRNSCLPRGAMLRLGNGNPFDDVVSAYRLARRLEDHGVAFQLVATGAESKRLDRRRARALGADAARLYAEEPATFGSAGLDRFREASLGHLVLRRALLALPRGAEASSHRMAPRGLRRIAIEALYWKGVRQEVTNASWRSLKSGVCILMYHAFGTNDESASRYVIPARRFRLQLVALALLRRRVMSLDAYVAIRARHGLSPPRTTIITIDDGYDDTYKLAAPLLAGYRFPATVFVVSKLVGGVSSWTEDPALRGRLLADWDQLRRGRELGLVVGGHSRTHPALTELDLDAARLEIEGCRRDLAEGLDTPVTAFAYPFGDEDEATRGLVLEAGYAASCSSRGGPNAAGERLDSLRRIEIRGDDPLWRFVPAVLFGTSRPVARVRAALSR